MSLRFPCACPRAKQVVGQKSWIGWAGQFAFPGFKANWASGAWQFTADGGAIVGSAANFAAGDLVLRENPAEGPMTDVITGLSQSYPKIWNVFVCTNAITGSAADPFTDTSHWAHDKNIRMLDFPPFFLASYRCTYILLP